MKQETLKFEETKLKMVQLSEKFMIILDELKEIRP
jgi:hypothetical protein